MLPKCVTRKEFFLTEHQDFLYTYRTLFGRLLKGCQEELAGEKFPFPSIPVSIIFDVKNLLVDGEAMRVSRKKSERNFPFSSRYPKDCLNNKNELENVRSDSSSIPGILRGCWEKYSRKMWKFFHHTLERRARAAEVRWSNNIKTLYYIYSFPLVADLPYTVYRAIHRAMHVEPNENEMFLMWV